MVFKLGLHGGLDIRFGNPKGGDQSGEKNTIGDGGSTAL